MISEETSTKPASLHEKNLMDVLLTMNGKLESVASSLRYFQTNAGKKIDKIELILSGNGNPAKGMMGRLQNVESNMIVLRDAHDECPARIKYENDTKVLTKRERISLLIGAGGLIVAFGALLTQMLL